MAVDFAVPLITNVKCAKLFVEALVRKMPLDVSSVDYKTSHAAYIFPGLIGVSVFVPGINTAASKDVEDVTKASLGGGLTTALILPFGKTSHLVDSVSLENARAQILKSAYCNFALSVAASSNGINNLDSETQAEVKSLYIPYTLSDLRPKSQITTVAAHFAAWPPEKPIVTDARGPDLASVLLLANLHNRTIHVTDVRSQEDLLLISLSKAKQLRVTCDVSIYSLFYSRDDFKGSHCLPSKEDQMGLWSNLDAVDVFSIGVVLHELASELNMDASPSTGIEDALPLLLTAVTDGRLTLADIQQRLHDNPVRIFGLPEQSHTQVEVIVNRRPIYSRRKCNSWSPVDRTKLTGAVNRVVLHGQTVFLDGQLVQPPLGRDVSSATINRPLIDGPSRLSMAPHTTGSEHLASTTAFPVTLPKSSESQFSAQPVPASLLNTQTSLWTSAGAVASTNAIAIASAPRVFSPITPHPAFHRKNILSVRQFTHQDIHDLFNLAHEMRLQVERNGTLDILKGKVLCTLFYEPSTRTSASFDAAMKRCGGQVIQVGAERSSVLKGETLADTIRTLSCYADAIVIRHPEVGSSQTAAKFSPVPIINAGDGIGEHPTQV